MKGGALTSLKAKASAILADTLARRTSNRRRKSERSSSVRGTVVHCMPSSYESESAFSALPTSHAILGSGACLRRVLAALKGCGGNTDLVAEDPREVAAV